MIRFDFFNKNSFPVKKESVKELDKNISLEGYTQEEKYKKELLPIIEILKPDDMSLEEYEKQITDELFATVKQIQIAQGVPLENPEKTIEQARGILISRINTVLEDARNQKKDLDSELVKKARIVLLAVDDFSDLRKYTNPKDLQTWSIKSLEGYIVGNKKDLRFSSSDIDVLMKTKYNKNLTDSQLYSYEENNEIPKSLLVGLTQSELTDRSYVIENALKSAENKKYDNESLEQLLASGYTKLSLEYFNKFKGESLEKILKSGNLDDKDTVEYLISLDLAKDEFERYIDMMFKHNVSYRIRSERGFFYNNNNIVEIVKLNYKDTIEKLYEVEMDVHKKNESSNITIIKEIIYEGNIGLALATPMCKIYIKKYVETDYENFKKYINKYNQEHLVFDYLKDEDKIKYAYKLIEQGEEYEIIKLHELFTPGSLDINIYNKIKEKGFLPNLKGKLSAFKEIPTKEALELIDNGRVDIFLKNLDSFDFSEDFLHTDRVQNACFAEFNKEIMTFEPYKARIISEKIPFPKNMLDQAILKAIKIKWVDQERNDWTRDIIYEFPYIKDFLKNPEDEQRAFEDLDRTLRMGYIKNVAQILECFPLSEEYLKSEEVKKLTSELIEKSSHKISVDNKDFKKEIESYFTTIRDVSKYIEVPLYLFEQEEKIYALDALQMEGLRYVKNEFVLKILYSKTPVNTYENIVKLTKEIEEHKRIHSNKILISAYISKFEYNANLEDKQKFIDYVENITKNVNESIIINNWDYLYENFAKLPKAELIKHKDLIEKLSLLNNSYFLKNVEFENTFEQLMSYTREQQDEMFNIIEIGVRGLPDTFEEKDWAENTLVYINDLENLNFLQKDENRKNKISEMFGGNYKDIALSMMSKEWRSFLESNKKVLPPNIFFISKLIHKAGGAGNLKHLESLGNLIYKTNIALENSKTVEKTKKEIKNLLSTQEIKFDKEKWSQDDRSEFYNLSKDIIEAAPSLYANFSLIFEQISPKEMKIFLKEIFPFYQAQLIIIQGINGDNVKYKEKELVVVRQSIKSVVENIYKSPENIKTIFEEEKLRLLKIVRDGFKDRFGLLKVPEEFSKENLRSIQNGILYIGNINGRNLERETIISFYLGLELNGEWEAFRQGKEIKIEEYFSGNQLDTIKQFVEEKMKGYELLSETVGISKEQMPKFQEILQEDTISNMVGNIQTIDIKLGNIKRNVEELTDPDIYENQLDKDVIQLLAKEGKSIGSVLAKIYVEVSGKKIDFTLEERELQSKISDIFQVNIWSTDQVKKIQDTIQPLSLVSNMINKMNEEKVDKNIQELQIRLKPTNRIIEIFNRLGEEFKQESGAMALSQDVTYLESILVKDDKKLTLEEKAEVTIYLDSIKDKMKDLENTLNKVREYFNKIKKSAHLENHTLLKTRLDDIEKIIYSTDSNAMIVSHMTKDLNLIIENMRQCLGCMRKEINNDTNLAFGDYNKFFMMNQAEKEKGSISDEIVFFVPIQKPGGNKEMSFVLDRVYGSKSSDVLIGNILSVYKKYQAIKKEISHARISISVTTEAMSSVGVNTEILKKRLSEVMEGVEYEEFKEGLIADIPKSAFSDNYVEFGDKTVRTSGERTFGGLILR